jgi:hypothetical protein
MRNALCYNFTRVLNILGHERFIAYMAAKIFAAFQRAYALAAISNRIQATAGPFWAYIAPPFAICRTQLALVG